MEERLATTDVCLIENGEWIVDSDVCHYQPSTFNLPLSTNKRLTMDGAIKIKSYNFSLRIIKLYQFLQSEKREYVLSKQLLRSGTAIGALVREAEHAQSKADFINKMNIALKEANETVYWLELLRDSEYLSHTQSQSIIPDSIEILKLLVSIVKTSKQNLNK
ncbi:four helix bundle protein [Vibrio sp. B1Z05]|uniref:four helix bundle protein n=1 Tax=Vibrio sp. B1Z05 TaxID=2654980 RepID=UPI001C12C7F2